MYGALVVGMVVAGNVLGVGMIAPQVLRLLRTRQVDGISGAWAGVGVAMNLWWFLYAVSTGVAALVPVSAGSLSLYAVVAWIYGRHLGRSALPGLAFGALGLGLVPLPFLVFGGWQLAGVAIGLSYGLQLAPAVVAAVRSPDPVGVSAATWLLAWLEAAIWLGYGFLIADLPVLIAGVSGVVMASIILARLAAAGRLTGFGPGRRGALRFAVTGRA